MIRPLLTEIGIFLVPFALYAAYLIVVRSKVLELQNWPLKVVASLTFTALILTILSLVFLAEFSGMPPGADYVPAHMKDGVLIRGGAR